MDTLVLGGKYQVIHKLGKGGFGVVYKVMNMETNQYYAMKIEKHSKQHSLTLQRQIQTIQDLQGTDGVFKIHDIGIQEKYSWVVVDLLGPSVHVIAFTYPQRGNQSYLRAIYQIGIQIISRLQSIHLKGYVHRDVKPQNFVFSLTSPNFVHLVDFGLCQPYVNYKHKKQFPISSGHSFVGTPLFASRAAHLGKNQYRKDDLESALYVLVYLLKGGLPWEMVNCDLQNEENLKTNIIKIRDIKCNISRQYLCQGLPDEFKMFANTILDMNIFEKPNYQLLKSYLKSINESMEQSDKQENIQIQEENKPKKRLRDLIKPQHK